MMNLNHSKILAARPRRICFLGQLTLAGLLAASVQAQTCTVLEYFGNASIFTSTGESPQAPLIQGPDGSLYGTASGGGANGSGVVFKIQPDGTGFTTLHSFTAAPYQPTTDLSTNSDGAEPVAGLVLSGNTLYGATAEGSTNGSGLVFAVNTDGTGFTVLYTFSAAIYNGLTSSGTTYPLWVNNDGANPEGTLALLDGTLYGTTFSGGTWGFGAVFAVNTNGSGFTNLYSFTGGYDCGNPHAGLVVSGSTLYGTTMAYSGLISGYGTVFSINTNGSGFTTIFAFTQASDGANPNGGLVLSGDTLYGTTFEGGGYGYGTVFSVKTNGSGFATLHGLNYPVDLVYPQSTLVLSGGMLYGTASAQGNNDPVNLSYGSVFALKTNGSGFTNLYEFRGGDDGSAPTAGLMLSGGTLYGTATGGGTNGVGTLFKINSEGRDFNMFYSFAEFNGGNTPKAGLVLSGSTLFGTTSSGGSPGTGTSLGNGTIFSVNVDGSGFTNLYFFTPPAVSYFGGYPWPYTNGDGANPKAALILSGETLYGTASAGGTNGAGTVFKINTDGSGFTSLHSFAGSPSDGSGPSGSLVLAGGTLYGTAASGGTQGYGTVFSINTDGSAYTILHNFAGSPDGANPYAGLVLSGHTLYGSTEYGGANRYGTLFALNTDGSGFTNIYNFSADTAGTNNDGANPYGALVVSGGTLFGTTESGGAWGSGTVFNVNADGSGFKTLHAFDQALEGTNSDGANPYAGLFLSGGRLYGTTEAGSGSSGGTVFSLNTDGSGFTVLYNFPSSGDFAEGAGLYGGVILSEGTLYGTTSELGVSAGESGDGTVFSLSLPAPPPLNIRQSGANVILTWPARAASPALQSTMQLGAAAVWNPVPSAPVVVNGQNVVTIPIIGAQQYFKLQY